MTPCSRRYKKKKIIEERGALTNGHLEGKKKAHRFVRYPNYREHLIKKAEYKKTLQESPNHPSAH